nr:hypothetical protein Itr_chr02CG11090 [Ipomoea trifida]
MHASPLCLILSFPFHPFSSHQPNTNFLLRSTFPATFSPIFCLPTFNPSKNRKRAEKEDCLV